MSFPLKRYLAFQYQTGFDVEVCKGRLTEAYKDKQIKEGERFFYNDKTGWGFNIERTDEALKLCPWQTRVYFCYKVKLLENDTQKTTISCKHNPLGDFGAIFIALCALLGFFALVVGALLQDVGVILLGLVIFGGFASLLAFKDYTARSIVDDYLRKALEAEEVLG